MTMAGSPPKGSGTEMQRLLKLRNVAKARKPNFKIQNSNDPKKRFAGRWKRPKGLQSKMRERRKGNPKYIEPGYGSPSAVKGATADGLFPVVVSSVADLSKVKEGFGAVVSAGLGMRKKAMLVRAAVEKKLRLINVNAEAFLKSVENSMASRKKRRQGIVQGRKSKAVKEAKKAAAAEARQEGIETKVDGEEKKKIEKAEKDKIITKAR